MVRIAPERLAASRALAEFIGSAGGRRVLAINEYQSETPILPAHESETMVSVMSRARQHEGSAAVVAVHFPGRRPGADLAFVKFQRNEPVEDKDKLPTGGDATIGMVADLLIRTKRVTTVSVSQHVTAGVMELSS